jgi:hypothetical protein
MSFVCLWTPDWPTAAGPRASSTGKTDLPTALLAVAPHVVADARGVIWVDAHGLDATAIGRRTLELARRHGGATPRVGVAQTAIAAEVAAIHGNAPLVTVPNGVDVTFLAPFPLAVLAPSPRLQAGFADVGLDSCGDLARLTQASVEVRFGAEGTDLWHLARADDRRRIFLSAPRGLPSASLAWEEYVLRDVEQLLFAANRLVTTVCTELRTWGEAARALTLEFTLADRTAVTRPLRVTRATASRTAWMRLIRLELERLQLADGVTGLAVRVDASNEIGAQQGDVFDRGFQTARVVEDAVAQLGDDDCATLVEPTASLHPLPERRTEWQVREPVVAPTAGTWPGAPQLILRLNPEPRRITVATSRHRERQVPARFRLPGAAETELLTVLGPDHVSAGVETGARYAREYYTCLTDNGLLVLLYRDVLADAWFLHGWWD